MERVTAMAEKRVMVLKNDTLFMAAVLSLLREQPTLEVLGIATGDKELRAKMCGFSPDVVVLAAKAPDIGRNSSLSTILQGYPEVPVVALNESTSEIRTYLGQRVISSATAADLLSIIAGTVPVNRIPREEQQ